MVRKQALPFVPARYNQTFNVLPQVNCVLLSAIAGIVLKSELCCFFQSTFRTRFEYLQIFCSTVSISVRLKFLELPTTIRFSCDETIEW